MKAEKVNELIDWAKGRDINPDSIFETRAMYSDVSYDLFDWALDFDVCTEESGSYIICSYYVNIEWKQWFSAVVSRDCSWWYGTPEDFAHELWELYDRAMEIQSYFNS